MHLHGSSHTEEGHLLYTCAPDIIKCLSSDEGKREAVWVKGSVENTWYPVYASSKKQNMVCLSSGESELMALVGGACEGIATRDQWSKLCTCSPGTIVLCTDSSAALGFVKRKGASRRTRHVDTKVYFMQDWAMEPGQRMLKVHGDSQQVADFLTKIVTPQLFVNPPTKHAHLSCLCHCAPRSPSITCTHDIVHMHPRRYDYTFCSQRLAELCSCRIVDNSAIAGSCFQDDGREPSSPKCSVGKCWRDCKIKVCLMVISCMSGEK